MSPTPTGGGPERTVPRPPPRRGPAGGSLAVFVSDEQDDVPIDGSRWAGLAEAVLTDLGVEGEAEVSLLFVGEAEMRDLNQAHLGGEGPTDVLAFPIDGAGLAGPGGQTAPGAGRWPDAAGPGPGRAFDDPGDEPLVVGDVVVCPAVAARQAPEHAGTFDDEVALLVVHGLLHLVGDDHATDEERVAMQARERDLLTRFHQLPARDPWDAPAT